MMTYDHYLDYNDEGAWWRNEPTRVYKVLEKYQGHFLLDFKIFKKRIPVIR